MARTTTEIIDQAIRENRRWELQVSLSAAAFVIIGLTVIIWSLIRREPIVSIVGVAESALFIPALNAAVNTRKANIMLRMLEIPLNKANTSAEAAEMLSKVFESHFLEKRSEKAKAKGVRDSD